MELLWKMYNVCSKITAESTIYQRIKSHNDPWEDQLIGCCSTPLVLARESSAALGTAKSRYNG